MSEQVSQHSNKGKTFQQDTLNAGQLNSSYEAIDCIVHDGVVTQWLFAKGGI